MKLKKFGFIVTGGRFRQEQGTSNLHVTVVGLLEKKEAVDVARQMVVEGIQLIELCGGFGPVWAGKIIEAIDHAVPVGAVMYGLESVGGMHEFSKS